MIIELTPHLEQIAVQKAQQYNMRTEDFINKLVEYCYNSGAFELESQRVDWEAFAQWLNQNK